MFASRWPKHLPMHPGWLLESEIVLAASDSPVGLFEFEEVVLTSRGAEYWDGRAVHNPFIVRHKDHYLLYYMGTTHPFDDVSPGDELILDDPRVIVARSNKRIGLAISKSVHGPWKRLDAPILNVRPGKFDSYLTSNPAPCVDESGSVLLIYKARRYVGNGFSDMALGAAWADHFEGPYRPLREEPIFPPSQIHLEDPFIWKTDDGYRMIAKDMTGDVCGERHAGIYAYSENGLDWKIADNPKAYSRKVIWENGSIKTMGNFERPFLLFEDGRPTHLYAATSDGEGNFSGKNTWNMVIPLA
ncbi:glycoside hydrolase family protein [Paenibacillus sp. D2_2]|uniref:glycoside hydrolase family protein n=1 Tax=Paenibacillus sp. D2_2 TaxID=3073092 RepID=UPI00281657DD|nr:glycoside hydrolase family protein [Paenibacillus sp. D2_2]WMT39072.1 glycoside hydrolase family protein [Paenibacillus sp. D2_2]